MPADPEDPAKPWAAALLEDAAVQLPKKHCAFRGCGWSGSEEEERMAHLQRTHTDAIGLVAGLLPECYSREERFAAAYSEAIATIVREGDPTALYSTDRRCLFNYATACREDQVEAPICFFCACVYPRLAKRRSNQIRWVQPFDGHSKLCGFGREQAEDIFSIENPQKAMADATKVCQI